MEPNHSDDEVPTTWTGRPIGHPGLVLDETASTVEESLGYQEYLEETAKEEEAGTADEEQPRPYHGQTRLRLAIDREIPTNPKPPKVPMLLLLPDFTKDKNKARTGRKGGQAQARGCFSALLDCNWILDLPLWLQIIFVGSVLLLMVACLLLAVGFLLLALEEYHEQREQP